MGPALLSSADCVPEKADLISSSAVDAVENAAVQARSFHSGQSNRNCTWETADHTLQCRSMIASSNPGHVLALHMVVSLNYCSQNGGNLYRAPYYNGNPNIGPRIIGNLDQYPHGMSYCPVLASTKTPL